MRCIRINAFLIILFYSYSAFTQTKYIAYVKIGEKMPDSIIAYKYVDRTPKGCSCKVFMTDHTGLYGISRADHGEAVIRKSLDVNKAGDVLMTITFFYNKDSLIIGRREILTRYDEADAKSTHQGRVKWVKDMVAHPEFGIKLVKQYENSDKSYIIYAVKRNTHIYVQVKDVVMEEEYITGSTYKPSVP